MTKSIMAIYDADSEFGERFAEFVNFKDRFPVSIVLFSSLEELKSYSCDHNIKLLLINSKVSNQEIGRLAQKKLFCLKKKK